MRSKRAFTLIELLLVVSIIAILASLLTGAVIVARSRAKVKQNKMLMGDLARAWKTMKAAYKYSGAVGVDQNGEPLPEAQLDQIDVGWELDPTNKVWGPNGKDKADLYFNKRRMRFYTVRRNQVSGGHFVDVFGNRVLYRLVETTVALPDGSSQRMVEEWLISKGADGELYDGTNENDDEKVRIGTYRIK